MPKGAQRREYLRNSPPKSGSAGRSESSPHSRKTGVQSSLTERSAGMTRGGTAVRHRNPKRQAREWLRAYESVARVQWTQAQPCVVCGKTPCEMAHVRGDGGMGRKASARFTVPLCSYLAGIPSCHALLHTIGAQTFQAEFGVDLDAEAAKCEAAWQRMREIL